VIEDGLIAGIAAHVARQAPQVKTYLLTSRQSAAAIAEQHRVCGTTTLQLVDDVHHNELVALRRMLPHTELVQVIHVVDEASVQAAIAVARATGPEGRPLVDKLLLDSGNPNLAVKELGGTGRVHNWQLSRRIVEASPAPVLLAGGLNPENVVQALQTVRPHGLDLCSSVRTSGQLDAGKLAAFMAQAGAVQA
jgi:phosphoribosylanthranilate isomerase